MEKHTDHTFHKRYALPLFLRPAIDTAYQAVIPRATRNPMRMNTFHRLKTDGCLDPYIHIIRTKYAHQRLSVFLMQSKIRKWIVELRVQQCVLQ